MSKARQKLQKVNCSDKKKFISQSINNKFSVTWNWVGQETSRGNRRPEETWERNSDKLGGSDGLFTHTSQTLFQVRFDITSRILTCFLLRNLVS